LANNVDDATSPASEDTSLEKQGVLTRKPETSWLAQLVLAFQLDDATFAPDTDDHVVLSTEMADVSTA